jgi:hypothetical protein
MRYSDVQLAAHLHVNKSTAFRWRKVGCPTNDLEAAAQWAQNRKPAQKHVYQVTDLCLSSLPTDQ